MTHRDEARGKTQDKAEWRRWAKSVRSELDTPALSRSIMAQLRRWPLYRQAEHILTYLAFGSEIELSGLTGKHFYATRTRQDGIPTVHPLTGILERHPYGFRQPAVDSLEAELKGLELLLVPGLAFDTFGNRLGYGKGFYDRLLVQLPARTKNVPIVGVVPSRLIVPVLPTEPHDVRMTHLVSEKGVLEVEQRARSNEQ